MPGLTWSSRRRWKENIDPTSWPDDERPPRWTPNALSYWEIKDCAGSWHSTTELLPLNQQLKCSKDVRFCVRPKSNSVRIQDSSPMSASIDFKRLAVGALILLSQNQTPWSRTGVVTKPLGRFGSTLAPSRYFVTWRWHQPTAACGASWPGVGDRLNGRRYGRDLR